MVGDNARATAVTSGGALRDLSVWLRCGSCRFTAYYFLAFYAGLLLEGGGGWAWLAFGFVYWFAFSTATELTNRLSDRVEDEVNRPERTALCHRVGFDRIRRVTIALWTGILIADVAWLVAYPRPLLAALLAVAAIASVNYSFGVRAKRRYYLSPFIITFPFCGTFLTGWAVYGSSDRLELAAVFAITLGGFIFALSTVKDLTDVTGDFRVRFEGIVPWLVREGLNELIAAVMFAPFIFLLAMVSLDLLPERFLWLAAFMPAAIGSSVWIRRAANSEERAALREFVYHYWLALLCVAVLILVPTAEMAAVSVGAAAYWALTSRYMHWHNGITVAKVRLLLNLLSRPGFTQ
jgi:UbiA prenyltransferase family